MNIKAKAKNYFDFPPFGMNSTRIFIKPHQEAQGKEGLKSVHTKRVLRRMQSDFT